MIWKKTRSGSKEIEDGRTSLRASDLQSDPGKEISGENRVLAEIY
jgi:hypothetical protein